MAGDFMSEAEVIQELQISKTELEKIIADGHLTAVDAGGERQFNRDEVIKWKDVVEAKATMLAGGIDFDEFDIVDDATLGGYMSKEDAMQELQCSADEIDEFIGQGQLTPIHDAGTVKFQVADVKRILNERQQQATEFAPIGEEERAFTMEEALQELQCSRDELNAMIAEGKLTVRDGKIAADDIVAIRATREKEATQMREDEGEPAMSEEEVIQELGCSITELAEMVADGKLTVTEGSKGKMYDPGEVFLLRRQMRPSTVVEGEDYVSYDEALQELQTNRAELDRMIADAKLKPYSDVEGIKFRIDDIDALKRAMETRPTIMESTAGRGDGLFMMDDEAEAVTLDSVLLDADQLKQQESAQRAQGDDDDLLAEIGDLGGEPTSKVDLRMVDSSDERDSDQTSVIPVTSGESGAAAEEESIFDFGEDDLDLDSSDSSVVDIKVDMPGAEAEAGGQPGSSGTLEIGEQIGLDADESSDLIQIEDDNISSSEILPIDDDSEESSADSDIMTDVLQVGEEESSQEDILGDLIDLDDTDVDGGLGGAEEVTAAGGEETIDLDGTADVTADITQIDEETYEGTDLSEVLGTQEEAADVLGGVSASTARAAAVEEEEFVAGSPYVAPAVYAEEPSILTTGKVLVLFVVFVLLGFAGMFVKQSVENPSVAPKYMERFAKMGDSLDQTLFGKK